MEPQCFEPLNFHDILARESKQDYVDRMRVTLLPNMPEDVLGEWLYRCWGGIQADYVALGFENLQFDASPQEWGTEEVPLTNCGAYSWITGYAEGFDYEVQRKEWLATYMLGNGTWPVPIIFFDNYDGVLAPREQDDAPGFPFHLLEGHRRLGYFLALKQRNQLRADHKVWVARKTR